MAERYFLLTDGGYVTDSVPASTTYNPLDAIYFVTFDAAITKGRIFRDLTGVVPTITSVSIPFPRPTSYHVKNNNV